MSRVGACQTAAGGDAGTKHERRSAAKGADFKAGGHLGIQRSVQAAMRRGYKAA